MYQINELKPSAGRHAGASAGPSEMLARSSFGSVRRLPAHCSGTYGRSDRSAAMLFLCVGALLSNSGWVLTRPCPACRSVSLVEHVG
jgi:hypothetical protein